MSVSNLNTWAAVIVAAGTGTRFGGQTPKQFMPLLGKPVLAYALDALTPHGPVVIAVDDPNTSPARDIITAYPNATLCKGGNTRQESVKNALKALSAGAPKYVMIHDAARPLIDQASITRLKQFIETGTKSATLSIAVHDTLMRGSDNIDRTNVRAVQTPQAFDFQTIMTAHNQTDNAYTDDASLVHDTLNIPTTHVDGTHDNFKITTQSDFDRAQKTLLASLPETRTGMAFDVHAFGAPGTGEGFVTLCGVQIKCDQPLIGHSDADAPLHALADAILGTIGAGDIGVHFPPTDMQWKGMDSSLIVKKALELLNAKGGVIRHADIMIMSEIPKIGPHREAMQKRLSEILGLPLDAIGLKATTMEQLGFVGRREGLTAQAIVTVRLP